MIINYHNRKFKPISTTTNGEVSEDTIFEYHQNDTIMTCTYYGSKIKIGHLIGIVSTNGDIDMRYHQINTEGILMTGLCKSKPEIMDNGKLRLHETWQWTSGDLSKGLSVLEEI